MAQVINAHSNGHAEPVNGLGQSVQLFKTVVSRLRLRRELNQLLGMSDHHLKDIGVQRDDIVREAMRPLWRS